MRTVRMAVAALAVGLAVGCDSGPKDTAPKVSPNSKAPPGLVEAGVGSNSAGAAAAEGKKTP